MKTAAIYRIDRMNLEQKEAIETVVYNDELLVSAHLKTLQYGYCEEPHDRPIVTRHTKQDGEKTRIILQAESDSDFSYVAYIGFRIKAEANKPTTNLI